MKKNNMIWRRPTLEEKQVIKKAANDLIKKMGRPKKPVAEKGIRISLVIEPEVLNAYKKMSKKQGKGYQTLINEDLKKAVKRAA